MARDFVRASNEYLEIATAPVTVAPLTVSCWANTDVSTTTDDYCLLQIQDASTTDDYWRLNADGDTNSGEFTWRAKRSSGSAIAVSTLVPTTGIWYHIAGIEISSSSRKILVDGGNSGTNATSKVPVNIDTMAIGRERDSTPGDSWEGKIAEVAVWSAALTDTEVGILAAGYSPLFVRPQSLVFYSLLIRDLIEKISGTTLANSGTTVIEHPPIIYPNTPFITSLTATPPTGAIMNQFQGPNLGADLFNGTLL